MSKKGPQLRTFMDKQLSLKLNGNRQVTGRLRGFDEFMNIVLDNCKAAGSDEDLGMVVVRGNSVVQFECLEPVNR